MVWRLPFPESTITSGFGYRTAPYKAFHTGVDFGSNRGKAIHAPSSGVVVAKGYNSNRTSGWGHYLWVKADDGAFYGVAHMAAASPVDVGDRVGLGDTLGTVGATGAAATYGPHLHLSISTGTKAQAVALDRDYLVDPIGYINARTSGTAGGIEDDMSVEAEQQIAQIHDAIFNPWYGMRFRQLAQHYWMLGLPLPQWVVDQFGVHVTPDSPFRALVAAGPGEVKPVSEVDEVDEKVLAAELAPMIVARLGDIATRSDLEAARDQVLTSIAGLPDSTLAALGLQRVNNG